MKKSALLLALSLAANAALVAAFFLRPAAPPDLPATTKPAPSAAARPPTNATLDAAQLAALASGDLAALKAAGLPDDTARMLIAGRAYTKFQTTLRTLQKATDPDGKYWQQPKKLFDAENRTPEQRLQMMKAQREFAEAVHATFGEDASPYGFGADARYAFLPAAKRELLRRIAQDYAEMERDVYDKTEGIQLPSDREKLKLLGEEKARDLAAALTPVEKVEDEFRNSPTAQKIRTRYGDAIQTEADYRRIFALQKAFDDRFTAASDQAELESGRPASPEVRAERQAAQQKLQADILATIGPEKYAAFRRANDEEHHTLTALSKRLRLPETAVPNVYSARETYATQSQQIAQNPALSSQDRRTQLQGLAAKATADLTATLGAEGAEAYAKRSAWLSMLKRGTAFSTNPKDTPVDYNTPGTTVYPVKPPPAPTPAAPTKG